MANYQGLALVDVMIFCDYEADGVTIPASEDSPCKVCMPITVAERFVRNGLAEYCDVADVDGPPGEVGLPGCAGQDGTDGSRGAPGDDGCEGEDGKDGASGMTGDRGRIGRHNNTKGPDGRKGCPGLEGEPGRDGDNGIDGDAGEIGETGQQGAKGATGGIGLPGADGMVGDIGPKGQAGNPGVICQDGPIECVAIDECTYRVRTFDKDCNVLDDIVWSVPKSPGKWCTEQVISVDFDATDFKTSDTVNGVTYEVPVPGTSDVCHIELKFGVPSNQPCRSNSCGYSGDNPYEDTHPNINAYGPANGACEFHEMEVCFDKAICGDIAIAFFDVDEYVKSSTIDCSEKIKVINTSGGAIVPSATLTESPSGIYSPAASEGTGNTNTDGTLTWSGLDGVRCLKFEVQLQTGQSMGFGFAGVQNFKIQETGTYLNGKFYDANGNQIPEPDGWVDCT